MTEEEDPNHVYNDYHIDIWFLISEHIDPEDIQRFSLICKKTAEVVGYAKFWQSLYKKYYNPKIELPTRLMPDCMVRLRGLRSCVIKSLFYLYQPMKDRLTKAGRDHHVVENKQCIGMWFSKLGNFWNFYFKLKGKLPPGSRMSTSACLQKKKSSLLYLDDTFMNPEEACQVLVLTTNYFSMLPQFYEKINLKRISLTPSQGLTRMKVKLFFTDYCNKPIGDLEMDPVLSVRILDWWHPDYNHSVGLNKCDSNF